MSRLLLSSDLHLGHKNIHRYRDKFSTAEEHHEVVFDNLATNVKKRDSLVLLGDVAFTPEWLDKVGSIICEKKTLVLGNHDTDRRVNWSKLIEVFDSIHGLWSKRNVWFSHCPIHPQEMRNRLANIHGHLHGNLVMESEGCWDCYNDEPPEDPEPDYQYINICLEYTDYKPISYHELQERYEVLRT